MGGGVPYARSLAMTPRRDRGTAFLGESKARRNPCGHLELGQIERRPPTQSSGSRLAWPEQPGSTQPGPSVCHTEQFRCALTGCWLEARKIHRPFQSLFDRPA
jgi:hypothetical protein